jgi:hypothetical protein
MAKSTIYAYLIGNDFKGIATPIVEQINSFIGQKNWICSEIWAVNQQRETEDGSIKWELGINLDLPDPYQEPPGWFEDVNSIISFCVNIRKEYNHYIVIGISDNESGITEDIIEIDSDEPDIEYIKNFIGVEPPT